MNDYIYSRHKLTFSPAVSPTVLLDYGNWIDADLTLQLQSGFEVIDPIDSAAAFIRDMKVRKFFAAVTTYTESTLDKDALVAAMHSLITVQAFGKAPLRVEIQGHAGHYWQFSTCGITTHAPVRVTKSNRAFWSRTYNIVASGLSYT